MKGKKGKGVIEKFKREMIIFTALTLFISLFWPYAYTIKEPYSRTSISQYKKVNLLSEELRQSIEGGVNKGGCADVVETVSLDADDYKALSEAYNKSTIDLFGNEKRYESQKELDSADVSENPGVNQAKNQYITTANGDIMYVFNAMQHSATPLTPETCYLNNIISKGYMSYASKEDQNIRFCGKYGAEPCEIGRYSINKIDKIGNKIKEIEDFKTNFYNADGTIKKYQDIDWNGTIKEKYENLKKESNTIEDYSSFKSDCLNSSIPNCLSTLESDYSSSFSTGERGKWNVIESNYTQLEINGADVTISVPTELAGYVKDILDLKAEENIIMAANAIVGAISLRSIWQAYKGYKAWRAIKTGKKAWDDAQSLEQIGAASRKLGKVIEGTDEATAAKKLGMSIDEIRAIKKINRGLDKGEKLTKILDSDGNVVLSGTKITPEYTEQAINDYAKLLKQNGAQKYGDITLATRRDGTVIVGNGKNFETVTTDAIISPKAFEKANSLERKALNIILSQETGQKIILTSSKVEKIADTGLEVGGGDKVNVIKILIAEGSSPSSYSAGRIMRYAETISRTSSFSERAISFLARWGLGFYRNMQIARLMAYVPFFLQQLGGDPAGFYEVSSVIFTLTPLSGIKGAENENAYVDLVRTSKNALMLDKDIYPNDFFTNTLQFIGVKLEDLTGKSDYSNIKDKIENIGQVVSIVDQETGVEALTENKEPINIIKTTKIEGDSPRWLINSINPDNTRFYAFEDPKSYIISGTKKYTAMGLVSNSVNITGLSVKNDYAHYNGWVTATTEALPGLKEVILMSLGTAFIPPLISSKVPSETMRLVAGYLVGKQVMGLATEMMNSKKYTYGQFVNIKKAFESGKRCKDVRAEQEKNIKDLLKWKAILAAANAALEVVDMTGAAAGPYGAAAMISLQITVTIADYQISAAYDRAKGAGMQAMKSCYETRYEFLSWQTMSTEKGETTGLENLLKSGGLNKIASAFKINVGQLNPAETKAISTIGTNIEQKVLDVSSDKIKGKSMIRLLSTKLYKLHFDKDSKFSWFLQNNCQIQLCHKEPDDTYKCMTKQGYTLFNDNMTPVFEGPQNQFLEWNNYESYASIPQRVINIAQADEPLMKITKKNGLQSQEYENNCVKKEIAADIGVEPDSIKLKTELGNLQAIVTEDAMIWFEPGSDEVTISFTKPKVCGNTVYNEAQTIRIPKGSIEIMRNGKVKVLGQSGKVVGGDNCEYDIGTDGTISFENGMIMKAKQGKPEYTQIDGKPVLHMVIRQILSFGKDELGSMGIHSACDCIAGAQGVNCTTEEGKSGALFGFQLSGELTDYMDNNQLNKTLANMCFNEGTGQNNETFGFEGNQFCITQADGTQECYNITNISSDGLETSDGGRWQIDKGPNGPEWWYYNKDGEKQGNPIPIMWLNGLGGSMYNNPDGGRISIKNEFPFAINPSFHEYGALANGGFATPGLPPWGGRSALSGNGNNGGTVKKSIAAQLPGLPVSPYWMTIFMIALIASLLAIRVKYSKEQIEVKEKTSNKKKQGRKKK